MAHNNSSKHAGHGGGGSFGLGVLIGAGLVLLLTTEKGRKILKEVSEEGLSKIGEFLEEGVEGIEDAGEMSPEDELEEDPQPKRKRLFRGIRR